MSQKNTTAEHWDSVIESRHSLFDINLKELWHYRDLLVLFVRRDFVTVYKQTILGPLWFFIQPLLTTITFTIILVMWRNYQQMVLQKLFSTWPGLPCGITFQLV